MKKRLSVKSLPLDLRNHLLDLGITTKTQLKQQLSDNDFSGHVCRECNGAARKLGVSL